MPPATHLSAGPVPSRVDACVKAGLLDLVDDDSRLARWQQRRECGELTDRAPGGAPPACWPPSGPRS